MSKTTHELERAWGQERRGLLDRINELVERAAKAEARLEAVREQKKPNIGDRVIVGHWRDFDPMDAIDFGILSAIKNERFYVQGNPRGWRHCVLVARKELFAQEDDGDSPTPGEGSDGQTVQG